LGRGPLGPGSVSGQTLAQSCKAHTIFLGRGQDDRNVEELSDGRMCDHVVVVERAVKIAGQVEETDLVVDDQ
jgi:hypothetical protein